MEVQPEWALGRRKVFLLGEAVRIADRRAVITKALPSMLSIEQRAMLLAELDDLNNDYRKIQRQIHAFEFPNELQISEDDIDAARATNIAKYLPNPVKGKMTKCFNHEDKSPSMQVNNTWVYCHSCCRKWDTIDLVRQVQGLDFVRAVKFIKGALGRKGNRAGIWLRRLAKPLMAKS